MTRHRDVDRGQATVEFALCLPLVLIVMLTMAQLVIIGLQKVRLVHTTREAARSAAIAGDPATSAARAVESLGARDVEVVTSTDEGWVTVRVRQTFRTDIPVVGPWLPDIELEEEVTMLREPPLG